MELQLPRALVVEDEPRIRKAVEIMLAQAGYEVHVAIDGGAAMELFDRHGADLVISDLAMPKVNGLQLISALMQRSPSLPVIAITGFTKSQTMLESARDRGAAMVLPKPFGRRQLLEAISSATGS